MATIRAFNTEPYNVSSNPKGVTVVTPSAMDSLPVGTYANTVLPTGGATGTNPSTDITIRVRTQLNLSNSDQGYVPSPKNMRWTSSANTGANDGTTDVPDAARGVDHQYFKLEQVTVSANDIVKVVECAVTDVTDTDDYTVGVVPPYVDLKFNPRNGAGDTEGELDRDFGAVSGYKYRWTLSPALPALTIGTWAATSTSVTAEEAN